MILTSSGGRTDGSVVGVELRVWEAGRRMREDCGERIPLSTLRRCSGRIPSCSTTPGIPRHSGIDFKSSWNKVSGGGGTEFVVFYPGD